MPAPRTTTGIWFQKADIQVSSGPNRLGAAGSLHAGVSPVIGSGPESMNMMPYGSEPAQSIPSRQGPAFSSAVRRFSVLTHRTHAAARSCPGLISNETTEKALIRDILFVFQGKRPKTSGILVTPTHMFMRDAGIDGAHVKYSPDTEEFVVDPTLNLPPALRDLVCQVCCSNARAAHIPPR